MARAKPTGRTEKNKSPQGRRGSGKSSKKTLFSAPLRLCGCLCALLRPKHAPTAVHPTKALGDQGERAACRMLKKARLKILARNYRCPSGEIDIIALDRSTRKTASAETIVFVEVKTRAAETPAGPESAVDARKRSQIKKAARYYLRHHPTAGYLTRYDIVAVVIEPNQPPRLRHLYGAF